MLAPPYRVGIKSEPAVTQELRWVYHLGGFATPDFIWIYRLAQLAFQVVVAGYLVRSALFLPRSASERLFYAAIALLIIYQVGSGVWHWFG